MQKFDYGSYRLAYETHGTGDRNLVLLHGIMMNSDMNRHVAREFAKAGYRVHLIDLLGHGESDKASDLAELRMDHYADQVAAFLDYMGIERAVIGGVSLGAIVTLQVGVRHPTRVEAMMVEMPVLENAVPGIVLMLAPLLLAARFLRGGMSALFKAARKLPAYENVLYRSMRTVIFNDPSDIEAILSGALVGPIAPTPGERRAITAPTIVIGHPFDALHPFTDAEALARVLPNGRFVAATSILEMRLRPARLIREICDFLDTVPRTPARPKPRSKLVS